MLNRHLIPIALAFFCTVFLMPGVILLARRTGAFAHADARRRIKNPIPLLGGTGIFTVLVICAFVFRLPVGLALVASALPVFLIGVVDDYRELSARPKVLIQLLSASLWIMSRQPGELALEQAGLLHGAAVLCSIVWIVGITNAMNLVDGLDGLAGGITFLVSVTLAYLMGNSDLSVFTGCAAGAVLGFLFFNLPPARVYLGDSGSTLLGFMLASSTSILDISQVGAFGLVSPMLLLAYPQVDLCLAIVRRAYNGKHIFSGDHNHIHHKLQRIGFSVPVALGIILSAAAYGAFGTITMWMLPVLPALFVLALTVIGLMSALTFIMMWDRVLGQRIGAHCHIVIGRYVSMQNFRTGVAKPFPGVLVDLGRAYNEFQHFTPDKVEEFAKDFAQLLKSHFTDGLYRSRDKKTIIVYFADANSPAEESLVQFREALKALLRTYNALDSEEENLENVVMRLTEWQRPGAEEESPFNREAA